MYGKTPNFNFEGSIFTPVFKTLGLLTNNLDCDYGGLLCIQNEKVSSLSGSIQIQYDGLYC